MKNIYLSLIFLLAVTSVSAQSNVFLKINHKLGNNAFALNTAATNNKGDNYEVTRLYYYISQITLYYNGGSDTTLEDHYIMVDARYPVNELLGSFNISTIDSISFGIGVDPGVNHSDITLFPLGHALSWQSPSMHWGWAAGYRFIAYEGFTGASMNQSWQLHALGDKNYGFATIPTTGYSNGSDLIIALDADYQEALYDIRVNPNLNYHGEDQEAPVLLTNFQTKVFTVGSPSISIDEVEQVVFTLAPNPSVQLSSTLVLSDGDMSYAEVKVVDVSGRLVFQQVLNGQDKIEINVPATGMYFVHLVSGNDIVESRKLIIL